MKRALLLVAGVSALASSGCPATGTQSAVQPTYSSLSQNVFAGCSTQACHGGLTPRGNLSLEASKAYAALVAVPPDNEAARADGLMRVSPGNPDKSFLLTKLHPITTSAYGAPMPVGGRLSDAQVSAVRQWIEQGAPND